MNKCGMVLGIAAVATLAGCKDPDYQYASATSSQNEAKSVDVTPAPASQPAVYPEIKTVDVRKCTCLPGTKHTEPCACGAADCKCIVVARPVVVADLSKPAAETTIYVVQSGDYLAKISKKFNVTINSIKRLNPSIKKDVIRIGQKLRLPGKVEVGAQPAASKPAMTPAAGKKAPVAGEKKSHLYTGATKEYVVKNGDTLGSIAYGNGISIRQLRALNKLTNDALKIGQKLLVPAAKVVAAKPVKGAKDAKKAAEAEAKKPVEAKPVEAKPVTETKPVEEKPVEAKPEAEKKADAAAAPAEKKEVKPVAPNKDAQATSTYVVQEGDDMTGVSIRWGVSAAEIRELNNLSETDQLVPGQIIKLPAEAQQ